MLKNKITNPKFIITNNASTQWRIFKLFRNPNDSVGILFHFVQKSVKHPFSFRSKVCKASFFISFKNLQGISFHFVHKSASEASRFGRMSNLHSFKNHKELNLLEDGDSSPNLKIWYPRRGCNEKKI